jgi:TRAP-type transport system periplasmic protein
MDKDKKVLFLMLVGFCVFLTLAAGSSAAEIKIALDSPPDLEQSGTYVWAKAFGDSLTSGGLKATEFPRDSLGGEEEKLDQVSQGLLEVSMSDLAKAAQIEPFLFGFHLPYIFDSVAHMDKVLDKTDLMKRINGGSTKRGVRVLSLVLVGDFGGLANTKRPVRVPADLKGLRIRAMDKAQTEYLQAWGASTVVIPWAEIYNSLQTGVADGYLNAAIVPVLFKHTDVIKHYSDIKFGASIRIAICSEKWYGSLSEKDLKIVHEAVVKANATNRTWQIKVTKTGLEALEKTGVKIVRSTPQERAEFAKLVRPVYAKVVGSTVAEQFVKAADAQR